MKNGYSVYRCLDYVIKLINSFSCFQMWVSASLFLCEGVFEVAYLNLCSVLFHSYNTNNQNQTLASGTGTATAIPTTIQVTNRG